MNQELVPSRESVAISTYKQQIAYNGYCSYIEETNSIANAGNTFG